MGDLRLLAGFKNKEIGLFLLLLPYWATLRLPAGQSAQIISEDPVGSCPFHIAWNRPFTDRGQGGAGAETD